MYVWKAEHLRRIGNDSLGHEAGAVCLAGCDGQETISGPGDLSLAVVTRALSLLDECGKGNGSKGEDGGGLHLCLKRILEGSTKDFNGPGDEEMERERDILGRRPCSTLRTISPTSPCIRRRVMVPVSLLHRVQSQHLPFTQVMSPSRVPMEALSVSETNLTRLF